MKILKFWYVACTIICIYNLNMLVSERYEVAILAGNGSESETEPTITLACEELSALHLNETEYELSQLRAHLYDHFNASFNARTEYWRGRYQKDFEELILNPIETRNYLIYNDRLCFMPKSGENFFDEFHNFFNQSLFHPEFFENSTGDFIKIDYYGKFDQVTVQKKGHPYSNCSNSRFRYLNDCFKRRFRLSRYFYDGNETGLIHLNSSMNRSVEESERSCFEECWREKCKLVQLVPFSAFRKPRITTILEAQPKLSEFDFWLQFIGLVCSFANISLNQFASILIKFASLRVKKRRVRVALFYLKWAIFFISLAYCVYLFIIMILDYKAKERKPDQKEIMRNQIKQKVIRLVICIDITEYFAKDGWTLDFKKLNKTMLEIEKATDRALDDYLEGIYLNYQSRMFRMDYTPQPKVLFQFNNGLSRCFSLLIRPDCQMMPSNPKLTIKFKWYAQLYLLTENENFNENTFGYKENAFMMNMVKRLKSGGNCIDYEEKYANCTSRSHCVERCINRESFREFKNITFWNLEQVVVDRDQFSQTEWNTAYPMKISFYDPTFSKYKGIKKRCEGTIPDEKKPCVEVKFEPAVGVVQQDRKAKEIDLFIDVVLTIEELSLFNFLLNIMNIQSIFFGMTTLRLLRILYNFIKPKLRVRWRNDKIALFFIYLLCSIGFTWHTYRILDLSVNGQLSYDLNYEIANRVHLPVLMFCHQMDEKLIDKNQKLTGSYLEQLSREMTAENVFKSITYLNESNEWTPFNLSGVERFFFMHLKCFRIRIHQEYGRRHFHFSTNSQIMKTLKVNFTHRFIDPKTKTQTVYFMTKTNDTIEFSKIVSLFYQYSTYYKKHLQKYSAEQSEITINYEDRLSFIKRYLSTSYEDEFSDFDSKFPQLNGSEYNFGTLKNPLEEEDLGYELQDDLFDQYFSQVHRVSTPNLLDTSNFQQMFAFNQLKRAPHTDSDLSFSLSLIKKTLSVKNEAKFILGLLNVLFWFDLGILDLHPVFIYCRDYLLFGKITQILLFSRKWLKKLEPPLYEFLNS